MTVEEIKAKHQPRQLVLAQKVKMVATDTAIPNDDEPAQGGNTGDNNGGNTGGGVNPGELEW